MADETGKPGAGGRLGAAVDALRIAGPTLVAVLAGVVVIVALARWLFAPPVTSAAGLWSLLPLVVIIAAAFSLVMLMRLALGGPRSVGPAEQPSQETVRDRLGPRMIGIGSMLIGLLVVATIGGFLVATAGDPALAGKSDVFLNGVFGAVLPVVATWVGTVLAFYFTRESFREATQSTRDLFGAQSGRTAADLMIPLEKLAKYVPDAADGGGTVEQSREAAKGGTDLGTIRPLFSPPVTRVPILDRKQRALFVLRQKLMPPVPAGGGADDLAHYLAQPGNGADAVSFRVVPGTATVADARRLFEQGAKELFVTESGRPDQAVRGMLTDDEVRRYTER